MKIPAILKGILYRSAFLYRLHFLFKQGFACDHRLRLAARYIRPSESVIDVCSGPGYLKAYLPKDCAHTAIEASPEFLSILHKKRIDHIPWDLHKGWPAAVPHADVIVMVISLSQFRKTSAHGLLESFKKAADRVVIVEEVIPNPRQEDSMLQRIVNYLCATDYYVPVSWYTSLEFMELMKRHGYRCEQISGRYMVGLSVPGSSS